MRIIVALLAILLVASAGAADFGTNSDGPTDLEQARALTAALQQASPAEALRLLAAEHGLDVGTTVPPARAAATPLADPAALPAPLVAPVGQLLAAVATADALVGEAVAGLSAEEQALLLSDDIFATTAASPLRPDGVDLFAATPTHTRVHSDAELRALADRVDMAKMVQATLLVLETLEDVQPQLLAYADTLPLPTTPASTVLPGACPAGPSIYDEPGRLAIDGPESGRFTSEYLLTIDLGGDDCYYNGAGHGALGASVSIDLGGADTYISGARGEGAGNLGVGILVDLMGDDTYTLSHLTTAPQPGPVALASNAFGQGAGGTGVGILVDGGGSDTYTAVSRSSGNTAQAAAQGGAVLGGIGLLLAGPGHSSYAARAESTLHTISQTSTEQIYDLQAVTVAAQGGVTLGGAAALVDLGGNDRYDAYGRGKASTIGAQGGALGGVGILVDALGFDSYSTRSYGDLDLSLVVADAAFCWSVLVQTVTSTTSAYAQGGAMLGAGILADADVAESDTFFTESNSVAGAHAEVGLSAGSGCRNNAVATADTSGALVHAQGAASVGAGILLGGGGGDTYSVRADSAAVAKAFVSHGGIGATTATATSGDSVTRSHGAGMTGVGIITDAGGDDAYLRAGTTVATERTTTGGTAPGTSGLLDHRSEGWTMTGIGWLIDVGGGSDTYSSAVALNDSCWTQPSSGTGHTDQARGRDLPVGPPPASCP